jgi:hypothetical protein
MRHQGFFHNGSQRPRLGAGCLENVQPGTGVEVCMVLKLSYKAEQDYVAQEQKFNSVPAAYCYSVEPACCQAVCCVPLLFSLKFNKAYDEIRNKAYLSSDE